VKKMSDGITDFYRMNQTRIPGDNEYDVPKNPVNRPTWDDIWSAFAVSISKRSYDPKHKVGAVIVTDDNTQVLAIGYNGDQKGGPNKRDSLEVGKSGFIHAELNALIKCDYNFPKNKKLYVTLSPCISCAKAIINAGIKKVIYTTKYTDDGIDLLKQHGIIATQYSKV
jgi:dCMP deaminase